MKMAWRSFGVLPALLWVMSGVMSAPAHEEDAVRALDDIEGSFRDLKSLVVSFHQEKQMQMFAESLASSGVIYFQAPDKMRFEMLTPFRSLTIVNGHSVAKYQHDGGVWRIINLTSPDASRVISGQLTGWLTGNLRQQQDCFEFTVESQDPVILKLSPKQAGIRRFIKNVEITFSKDRRSVSQITIRESGGDETRMLFNHQVRNASLEPSLFSSP